MRMSKQEQEQKTEVSINEMYKINPQMLNVLLLNQIVQNTKAIREINERQIDRGQGDYLKLDLTTTWQNKDFVFAWKSIDIANNGPDTALIKVETKELIRGTGMKDDDYMIRYSPEIDVALNETFSLKFNEERILSLLVKAQTSTATIKVTLAR